MQIECVKCRLLVPGDNQSRLVTRHEEMDDVDVGGGVWQCMVHVRDVDVSSCVKHYCNDLTSPVV